MTDRLPHEKGFHISWDQIHRDSRALAWRLDGQGPGDGGIDGRAPGAEDILAGGSGQIMSGGDRKTGHGGRSG